MTTPEEYLYLAKFLDGEVNLWAVDETDARTRAAKMFATDPANVTVEREVHKPAPPSRTNPAIQDVEELRKILSYYDDGICTAAEVGYQVLFQLFKPHLEAIKQGQDSGWGGPWCGGEPPPPVRATIEFGPARIWLYPMHSHKVCILCAELAHARSLTEAAEARATKAEALLVAASSKEGLQPCKEP